MTHSQGKFVEHTRLATAARGRRDLGWGAVDGENVREKQQTTRTADS